MTKPNFFIIGAPKCGTTALSEYLREHSNVFFSDPKEPHFFNEDFANRYTTNMADYLAYFTGATQQHTAIGEGSVFYLSSEVAVKNILAFQPQAKFIVMLRNPVEMAYSWHSQALYSFGEKESDFRRAWELQEARKNGAKIPRFCREPKTLMYGELSLLGQQLERLYKQVPQSSVKVIFFEDFTNDTRLIYSEVLTFLNLPADERTIFPPVNTNKAFRSIALERLSRYLTSYVASAKQRIGFARNFGILKHVRKINIVEKARDPLPQDFIEELKGYFHADVKKLARLTNRDLSHWLG